MTSQTSTCRGGRRDVGELVGEGDVDVAEGVLGELAQLGDLGAGAVELAADEALVELGAAGGAGVGEAADDALVLDDLAQDAPGSTRSGAWAMKMSRPGEKPRARTRSAR
jgi:hypothetical protein